MVAILPQSPDYAAMSKDDLIRILEQHRQTQESILKVIHLSNEKMAPGEKLAWIEAQCVFHTEHPDENGLVRLPIEEIGERIGMSGSSASRYVANMAERFKARIESVPYTTKKGQKRTLTYVDPSDPLWIAPWDVELPEENERTINGNDKRCPVCDTNNLRSKKRTITSQEIQECLCCGYRKVHKVIQDNEPLESMTYVPEKKGPQAGEPSESAEQVEAEQEKAQTSASAYDPITGGASSEVEPKSSPAWRAFLTPWLEKRIGERIICATGELEQGKKYFYKPEDYQADIAAYLAGDPEHIYGSRLRRSDGTTWVLAFDFDDKQPEHDTNHTDYMMRLANAGAAPLYFPRRPGRGHLEIHFSLPVDPQAACTWAIDIVPELAQVECFPCMGNQALSWPLYQRIGDQVTECSVEAMSPAKPGKLYACKGVQSDPERLAQLVIRCVTPASLVPAIPIVKEQERGALLDKSWTKTTFEDDLIDDFNRTHTWEEIAALCGGYNRRGYFKAVWRDERSPSVKPDADERYCCDFGNNGSFPKKLDKYGVYCLVKDIDAHTDLNEQRAAMRQREAVKV